MKSSSNHALQQKRMSKSLKIYRKVYGGICSTVALIGGLCILVMAQFVLFPILFSILSPDPLIPDPTVLYSDLAASATYSTTPQRKRHAPTQPADGTFNGAPLYLQQATSHPHSHVHCVGENYRPNAWQQRSCRFSFMCLDTSTKEFQIFQSESERSLTDYLVKRPHMHMSTTMIRSANSSNTISLGGINDKWGKDMSRLEWFPTIVPIDEKDSLTYYQLPDEVVLIPFHSLNGANPGHFVWDDLLPIYTLLSMFQLVEYEVLLLRYILTNGERGLWASCDLREEKKEACKHIMTKFLPLMVGTDYNYQFSTTQDFDFQPNTPGKSNLVCAKTGVAGIASLTDHGLLKSHGWIEDDYKYTHNHGRGGLLYDFRNFMLQNMGFPIQTVNPIGPDHRIVFSQKSSDIYIRSMDFERQISLVQERFPQAKVEKYVFKELSLYDQLAAVHDAAIYVTLCGGGAVTGMFLPKGSSVIIYYSEDGGAQGNHMTYKPALLDWDLFNAMSHLRVHWMPRNTMKTQLDEDALSLLIYHELRLIETQTFL